MDDELQLWAEHRPIAYAIARDFFIPGAEQDDVAQEALIALWVAACSYDPEEGTFRAFAKLIIRRRLVDCVKNANRLKQRQLTRSTRVLLNEEGEYSDALELLPHPHQVADVAEGRERLAAVLEVIDTKLTPDERYCLIGASSGYDYVELGPTKWVDNACFRARRKMREAVAA